MENPQEVTFGYAPRTYQLSLEEGLVKKKRAIAVWHRRAGKDVCCWNILINRAFRRKGIYYYVFPTYRQGRKALWEAIDGTGKRMLEYIPKEILGGKISHTEMRITLANDSIIRVLGSDDYDSVRGTNPIGVVFSEYAYQNPAIWEQVIEPILRLNGGWALFNSTPYGKNHFYELFNYAQQHPDTWFTSVQTIADTGLMDESDLEELRKQGTPEETIHQEYLCSFTRGVEGTYYGKLLEDARKEGRIGVVPHDPYAQVHTVWDLGMSDATAIWVFQIVSNEIHLISYFEDSGKGLPHYISLINNSARENGWNIGNHYAPHDVQQRELTSGISRLEMARNLGIQFQIIPRTEFQAGIEAVRKVLPRCWFSELNCENGVKALEGYQKKYSEKDRCFSNTPLHNWASHGADAFRYLAIAYELLIGVKQLSLQEYRELKKKHGIFETEWKSQMPGYL